MYCFCSVAVFRSELGGIGDGVSSAFGRLRCVIGGL